MFCLAKSSRRGATMIEYALLAALISIACMVVVSALGKQVGETFKTVGEKMPGGAPIDNRDGF
ncbi:MAG: Flp family type IVb pilin [Deltaproteobacteria bacterium]|nr:Flp family type IVb pilin [Deltaproteobacteria bacterium]